MARCYCGICGRDAELAFGGLRYSDQMLWSALITEWFKLECPRRAAARPENDNGIP